MSRLTLNQHHCFKVFSLFPLWRSERGHFPLLWGGGGVRRVREEVKLFLVVFLVGSLPTVTDEEQRSFGKHFYSLINQIIKMLVTDVLNSDQRPGL